MTLQGVVLVLVVVLVLALVALGRVWRDYVRLRETFRQEIQAGRKDAVQRCMPVIDALPRANSSSPGVTRLLR